MINNFDQSSTGDNITIQLYYDTDTARMEWEENFKTVRKDTYYYIDNGNIPSHDALEWSIFGSVDQMREYVTKECDYRLEQSDIAKMDNIQLQDEILEELARVNYLKLENKREFDRILGPYGMTFKPLQDLQLVKIRGYSQGDYVEIYVNVDALREVWGSEPDLTQLKTEFERYFYDQPIYGVITINDNEFYYEGDRYEFERTEWLESITKDLKPSQDHVKEWLLENVPEYVPYD